MSSVSIVIPCFNARHWIRATLESVFDQRSLDLQVIVVDDGSTDRSGDLVAQWFSNVELVRMDNGGPSRARNVGTRLARGQFIQYLDADDLLAPGKLEAQLEALTTSGADIAYGDWRVYDGGHMVYMRPEARTLLARDAAELYAAPGVSAPTQ